MGASPPTVARMQWKSASLLVVATLATAALLFALLLSLDAATAAADPRGGASPSAPQHGPATAAAPVVETAAPAQRSEVAVAGEAEPERPRVRLVGSVVVSDPAGRDHTDCDGQLQLLVSGDTDSDELQVDVRKGRFEAMVQGDARTLTVRDARLADRRTPPVEELPIAALAEPVLLRLRWLPELNLRVLDDATGLDLTGVRVVRSAERLRHPGHADLEEVLPHATSPLQLPNHSTEATQRFWVMAPGYAWDSIELVTAEPRERTLRLQPGGAVDVTVIGAPPPKSLLHVFGPQTNTQQVALASLQPAAQGATRIEGLPAGPMTIALEIGPWYRDRVTLGETTVTIQPNAIATTSITIRPDLQQPPIVGVRGTLSLSAAWGRAVWLELKPRGVARTWQDKDTRIVLAAMQPDGERDHRFGPVPLTSGTYHVHVNGCEHHELLEISPVQPADLHIVVPDPVALRLRLLDAGTEQPLLGAHPDWHAVTEAWKQGGSPSSMNEQDDGWYTFLAAPGPIEIWATADGYTTGQLQHTVTPGSAELVLRLQQGCVCDVITKEGDTVVPWPENAYPHIEHATQGGGQAWWGNGQVGAKEPGEYWLTMGGLDAFEPVPRQRVLFEAGKRARVEVVLRRKR